MPVKDMARKGIKSISCESLFPLRYGITCLYFENPLIGNYAYLLFSPIPPRKKNLIGKVKKCSHSALWLPHTRHLIVFLLADNIY